MIARSIDPLPYTLSPLDRATVTRHDDAAVRGLVMSATARFVPVWQQRHLVDGEAAQILTQAQAAPWIDNAAANLVFLGLNGEEPWFALGFGGGETPPALGLAGDYRGLNDIVLLLPGYQASILVYARAMVIWHETHRFCGRCGAATVSIEGGHSRTCTACRHRTFPRTDPVIITLISAGDRCLLGRQASWQPGVYSTIAGFVEPGETLETAVRREAEEETGVKLGAVRYIASQPWPFPASIMLGFHAEALTTEIRRKDKELEDCRWFTRAEVLTFAERTSSDPGFKLPNRYAIARLLLDLWLQN